jgi:starch phosphorylase
LTIGTMDGANIEICAEVGAENAFMFGLSAAEVEERRTQGYRPASFYESNADLRASIDFIRDGFFSRGDASMFRPLVDSLLNWDTYMLMADFQSYCECQDQVSGVYRDPTQWSRMSILNVARSGKFSSDRTICEYAQEIWRVPRVPIRLLSQTDLTLSSPTEPVPTLVKG